LAEAFPLTSYPLPLTFKEVIGMALDPAVKKNWVEIQKKFDFPVNAIGVKIKPNDEKTLKVWKEEGIENFMKK
jgi:hypothetical protein